MRWLILALVLYAMPAAAENKDGDTFTVTKSVRIFGIDAPEKTQVCKDNADRLYECGKRATDALAEIRRSGRTVCTKVGDSYGRDVSVCRAGGHDLGLAMLQAGWAVVAEPRYIRTLPLYRILYQAAQDKARATKRGIWAGSFAMPADWRRAARARR